MLRTEPGLSSFIVCLCGEVRAEVHVITAVDWPEIQKVECSACKQIHVTDKIASGKSWLLYHG